MFIYIDIRVCSVVGGVSEEFFGLGCMKLVLICEFWDEFRVGIDF